MRTLVLEEGNEYLERYVLLAVFDSSIRDCSDTLHTQVMFPWPFAGFTRDGDRTMWWEETLITLKLDLHGAPAEGLELARHLGIHFDHREGAGHRTNCPAVAFFPRRGTLSDFQVWSGRPTEGELREWVWDKLQMKVTIVNKTPWNLSQWWLDGNRGVKREDLRPDEKASINTYLSHAFLFRPDFVAGNALNNEVSVFV